MDDITVMAESKEELMGLLMKVKDESEKAALKVYIKKTMIMTSGPITSWQIDRETTETVTDFIILGTAIFSTVSVYADEWIRKLWYIYTMEYYSAIKKNTFESVLMRWIKLEPIIQSEVSQKEKHQFSILMHTYGI